MTHGGWGLARTPRSFDLESVRETVRGISALVSGGGGSIGAALSLALCSQNAGAVLALDSSEHALAALMSLSSSTNVERPKLQEVIANVRDPARLKGIVRKSSPDIVFHAAALKHVHLGDRHPTECVLTNLVGVRNMFDAANTHGTSLFVFISSDKAATPTSVMGACKRLAEIYVQGRNAEGCGTRALTVRFGNVLGSQGSVVEVFERQIRAGGPLTLTHRHMQRYFMTIDEAVSLILLATARAATSPDSPSYLLDMGAPVKILHLAQRMIEASGRDIAIVETGPREGEKLDEELYDEHETLHHTGVEGLMAIRSHASRTVSDADISQLEEVARSGDDTRTRSAVFELLHECLAAPSEASRSASAHAPAAARARHTHTTTGQAA